MKLLCFYTLLLNQDAEKRSAPSHSTDAEPLFSATYHTRTLESDSEAAQADFRLEVRQTCQITSACT